MSELELALTNLGRELDYPETPDLTGAVRRRLTEGRRPLAWRRPLVVALAALLVAVAAAMAVPQARSQILDWFGIGGVTIRYVEELPPVEKATGDLGLGSRIDLGEARRRAGFRVLVPRVDDLDEAPKVYYRSEANQVAFLYGSEERPKLLITQAGVSGAIEKLVTVGTGVERVMVGGSPGVWLSGEKHGLFYPGVDAEEPFRLVGNALVFETALGTTVRIEAEISKDEAIRIGAAMR